MTFPNLILIILKYFYGQKKKGKRENEDLYGHQQVNLGDDATCVNSQDVASSTPVHSFFYLWDFEVIHPQERTTEVFSISDIEESKGEEPFINLLSSLHKASGKRPLEEDKEKNKSKKKKHKKRDQEQDDIMEAQWRSKVDEELRLDELRARAGGASSSLVPTEVGLISGVDVEIECQTITTTPPAVEGTLEVSLSVPATTGTSIDVSGDIEAPAPFPDSEA